MLAYTLLFNAVALVSIVALFIQLRRSQAARTALRRDLGKVQQQLFDTLSESVDRQLRATDVALALRKERQMLKDVVDHWSHRCSVQGDTIAALERKLADSYVGLSLLSDEVARLDITIAEALLRDIATPVTAGDLTLLKGGSGYANADA